MREWANGLNMFAIAAGAAASLYRSQLAPRGHNRSNAIRNAAAAVMAAAVFFMDEMLKMFLLSILIAQNMRPNAF